MWNNIAKFHPFMDEAAREMILTYFAWERLDQRSTKNQIFCGNINSSSCKLFTEMENSEGGIWRRNAPVGVEFHALSSKKIELFRAKLGTIFPNDVFTKKYLIARFNQANVNAFVFDAIPSRLQLKVMERYCFIKRATPQVWICE
jgi:hypothetical protein